MSDSGSKLRAFVAELQRRGVFRVVAVYAVATFVILQVAEIVLPALQLPEWGITVVVALAFLGFPVALVLAWAFDFTGKGLVRTGPATEGELPRRSDRWLALAAVLGVFALTGGAAWYVLPKLPGWWGVRRGAAAERLEGRKLLVVLPFVNLGSARDEYFADGITEEITARLAAVPGLGVIARTTAVQYRNTDKTVRQIGQDLGVDYVLEGTVRWESSDSGPGRVRVTPQLIRVADDTHLWAQVIEKPLASVFEVQTEIAERVANALDLTLMEPERAALKAEPTSNLDAWRYYLLGKEYLDFSTSQVAVLQALEMFERAVELDPTFEEARKKLAELHASFYWANFRMAIGTREDDYAARVSRLGLESFGSDTQSYYLAAGLLNRRAGAAEAARAALDTARVILERRIEAQPSEPRFHAQLGLAYAGLGLNQDAAREGRLAVEMLPIAQESYSGGAIADNLAHIYVLVGDYDAAIDLIEAVLATEGPLSVAWLRVDPTWDPLRSTTRFQRLLSEGS
jgi:TolB-like protein